LETLIELILLVLELSATIILSPVFWVLVGIIGYQYVRMGKVKTYLFGITDFSVIRVTLVSTLFGILGGLFGSLLMVLIGVTISGKGLYYILILAVILMMIHPRFLCFAYAGGFLSLISLGLGYPNLNVPHFMALIAILHVVESILIYISGHMHALPVYTYNGHGQGVGGFNLQKFWPVPLIVMGIFSVGDGGGASLAMPSWWPLMNSGGLDTSNAVYGLLPAVVGLGYGELALTVCPRQRSRKSAWRLGFYSLLLLGLAVLASYYPLLSWAAAIFAPLGHEIVVGRSLRDEMEGRPKYDLSLQGVRLLEVNMPSPAYAAGLRGGDIISEVGGISIRSRYDLLQSLLISSNPVEVKYWREEEHPRGESEKRLGKTSLHWSWAEINEITNINGMILVPGYGGEKYLEFQTSGYFRRWMDRLRGVKR
jgi:hypothetical protein